MTRNQRAKTEKKGQRKDHEPLKTQNNKTKEQGEGNQEEKKDDKTRKQKKQKNKKNKMKRGRKKNAQEINRTKLQGGCRKTPKLLEKNTTANRNDFLTKGTRNRSAHAGATRRAIAKILKRHPKPQISSVWRAPRNTHGTAARTRRASRLHFLGIIWAQERALCRRKTHQNKEFCTKFLEAFF